MKAGANEGVYRPAKAQLGRGLSMTDAPEEMGEGHAQVLQNFRTAGIGRLTTRKAARMWDDSLEPVLGILPYSAIPGVAAIKVTYNKLTSTPITGNVHLWTEDSNGSPTLVGTLAGWEDVGPNVKVHMAQIATVVFFCDEDREHGLTVWDPLCILGHMEESVCGALFQPTFAFDAEESVVNPTPAYPTTINTHLNHLCMWGYESETVPDMLHKWRFSYPGLEFDPTFGVDAGGFPECESGSAGIFAVEDILSVLDRGERVILASSAPGRMIVCSERESHVVYGQDRSSWRKDKLDSQRGVVNSYAGGEADGQFWGWSHLGPFRYRGGAVVEDMTRLPDFSSIRPLLPEMDCESIFFGHQFAESHARFYYRRLDDLVRGCDRHIAIDYKAMTFVPDVLGGGIRVTCAGHVRPSILEAPAGAPSNLQHILITSRSALATWTPGDTTPGVRTLVALKEGSGSFVERASLDAGASRYSLTGLKSGQPYTTRVEEIRNGISLGAITDDFTTLAAGTVLLPFEIRAVPQAYQVGDVWRPAVAIAWGWRSEPFTLILKKGDDIGGPFSEFARVAGATSYLDTNVVQDTTVWYVFQAVNAAGDLSIETPPIPVFVTLNTTTPTGPGTTDEAGGESPDETEVDIDE